MDIGLDIQAPPTNEDKVTQLKDNVKYIIQYIFTSTPPNEKFNVLNTFLKSSGSLLRSPGFIEDFSRIHRKFNELIFYVPLSSVREACNLIQYFFSCDRVYIYTTKEFCRQEESLWGVRKIYSFNGINDTSIKLMAIRNSHTPLQVLKKVNLSFLEIWYDGENVNATDFDSIIQKKGILKGDKPFQLLKEIKSYKYSINNYIYKGYTITIDKEFLKKNNTIPIDNVITRCDRPVIDDEYYNKYTSKLFLRYLSRLNKVLSTFGSDDREAVILNFPKNNIKLEDVDKNKVFEEDDGFDSEELSTTDDFVFFMQFKSTSLGNETKLDIYHKFNEFINVWSEKNNFRRLFSYIYEIGPQAIKRPDDYKPFERYMYKIWRKIVQRGEHTGKCVKTGEEGKVYVMHTHTESNAISSKGLMDYLNEVKEEWNNPKEETDKNNYVPCFVTECNKFITPENILFLVDDDWYIEYFRTLYENNFIFYNYKFYKPRIDAVNDAVNDDADINNDDLNNISIHTNE